MKTLLTAAIVAGIVAIGVGAVAAPTVHATATKVSITLPDDLGNHFKPGPGSEVATNNCILCHSSALVAIQPPLNHKGWTAEVTKMRKLYGATFISDADAVKIADYLTTAYGVSTP